MVTKKQKKRFYKKVLQELNEQYKTNNPKGLCTIFSNTFVGLRPRNALVYIECEQELEHYFRPRGKYNDNAFWWDIHYGSFIQRGYLPRAMALDLLILMNS